MGEATSFKLAYLLALTKVETTAMLCITACLLSVGFLIGMHDASADYRLIWEFGSKYFWCYTFGIYGVIKAASLYTTVDYRINLANSVLGLWGWLYLCLSFTVFDTSPISPHELAFVVPVLAESWLLLSYQHKPKSKTKGVC